LVLGGAAVVATVIAAVATIRPPATSVVAIFLARLLRRCHGGSSSGLRALGALLNFLETKVLEGREGCRVGEDGVKMLVLFVEAAEYDEDEHTIRDVGAKIVEGVSEALHFLAIVVHVEVALNEVAEDGVDVEGTGLTVADELVL
jgi:hypothetical protein